MKLTIPSKAALAMFWLAVLTTAACETGKSNSDDDDDGGNTTSATSASSSTGSFNLCTNDCQFAFDGVCDDGGPGASYMECAYGTDCADCGPRESMTASVTSSSTTTVTTGPDGCAPMGADCSVANCCFDGAHLLSCYSGDGGTPYCCVGVGDDCGWGRDGVCCGFGPCVSTDGGVTFACEAPP